MESAERALLRDAGIALGDISHNHVIRCSTLDTSRELRIGQRASLQGPRAPPCGSQPHLAGQTVA